MTGQTNFAYIVIATQAELVCSLKAA